MAFDVSEFKNSSFQQDFYRNNLFEVTIEATNSEIKGLVEKDFKFMCKSAKIPGQSISTQTVTYMNRDYKVPGDMAPPEDATFVVYNNQSMALRAAFIGWIDLIQSRKTGIGAIDVNHTNLTANFKITPFDRAGNPIESAITVLEDGFPISVDGIDVAWANNAAPSEFNLVVAYSLWQHAGS